MLRIQRGLVVRVQIAVERALRRLLGADDPEHDNLVQISLERVLTTVDAGKFRGDCPLPVWAATVARNVAIDALRERIRERLVFDHEKDTESVPERPAPDRGPEQLTELHGRWRLIEKALLRLGPDAARIITLHDLLGYDVEEVAQLMGMTVAATQSRLVRGRNHVIERLRRAQTTSTVLFGDLPERFAAR